MTDIVKVDFKMKKDEVYPTYIGVNDAKRNMEEMLDIAEEYGRLTHDAIKRGIKNLDRLANELELYMEV